MLTPAAYRILADVRMMDDHGLRLFLYLLHDYDLRTYVALDPKELHQRYGLIDETRISYHLNKFCNLGLLERGPASCFLSTYRIRPAFQLTTAKIERHSAYLAAMREREMISPSLLVERDGQELGLRFRSK